MIIEILVVAIVFAVAYWIITLLSLPPQGKNIAIAVLVLVLLVYVVRNVFHVSLP